MLPHDRLPPLPIPHVPRPELAERLLPSRVTLLVAPAGYGKSVLLTEALRQPGAAAVCYLSAPADRQSERWPAELDLARRLAAAGKPTLLALDGAEALLGDEAACAELARLIAAAPAHLRLIIAGRELPYLPAVAGLGLAGAVAELRAADLLFSAADSRALLEGMGAPVADVDAWAGGWPAALRLLGAKDGPDWEGLEAYLQTQVWPVLTADEAHLLADLCLLAPWSPALADRVLQRSDSAVMLRRWERALPVDRTGRLHPLVVRHLAAGSKADTLRRRTLQRRAALWHGEQGNAEAALRHALAAEDLGLALPLLRQVGERLLAAGRLEELQEQLESAAPAVLEAAPELLLKAGEALNRAGQPGRALRWLRIAAVGCAATGEAGGLYRVFCRLALTHADLGEWSAMQAALRHIEAEYDGAGGRDRAAALRALGEHQLYQGEFAAAAERLRAAAELFAEHGDREDAGDALTGLGGALAALERWDEALQALEQAQSRLSGAAAFAALTAEVQILMLRRRWAEAETVIAAAAPGSRQQRALLLWLTAWLRLHQGCLDAARQLRADGELLLKDGDQTPLLQSIGLLTDGWLALAAGQPAAALAHGRQAARLVCRGWPLLNMIARKLTAAAVAAAGRNTADTAHAGLRVECFGALRVWHQGREVPLSHWGRAQVRVILQCLLLRPGFAAARESLLETLWPEQPPSESRARLRVALNRLRQALSQLGCALETGPQLIRLRSDAGIWVDLLVFREHLAAARMLIREAPEDALEHCRAAQKLCRGNLLDDAFWFGVEVEREQVRREQAELFELWHTAALRTGYNEEAISALQAVVQLEPGHEEAAARLIQLLIASGRRGEAVQRYRDLARWLKRELALEPSLMTRALLQKVLD